MPVLAADAKSDAYSPTFPEAAERIGEAVAFLKAKGYGQLAIVSHSMGSLMGQVYLAGKPYTAVKSWASLGTPAEDYQALKLPILDLYGENDLAPMLVNAQKRKLSLTSAASRQVVIPRTDHFFTGHEAEMVTAVADFLNATLK
jgi:pimeloyl-ACP methyl ester carboxylesterase